MGEMTKYQTQNLRFLKQQVRSLQDEENSIDPRPRIKQELWSARVELNFYKKKLRMSGVLV
tara:strand:- start:52 stop:234 length:183 start_codon:yes stop_codon:yes gene_type:complete